MSLLPDSRLIDAAITQAELHLRVDGDFTNIHGTFLCRVFHAVIQQILSNFPTVDNMIMINSAFCKLLTQWRLQLKCTSWILRYVFRTAVFKRCWVTNWVAADNCVLHNYDNPGPSTTRVEGKLAVGRNIQKCPMTVRWSSVLIFVKSSI